MAIEKNRLSCWKECVLGDLVRVDSQFVHMIHIISLMVMLMLSQNVGYSDIKEFYHTTKWAIMQHYVIQNRSDTDRKMLFDWNALDDNIGCNIWRRCYCESLF